MIPEEYRQYQPVVTVSCVNYNAVWGDKAANLAKIKANIEAAAAFGSNIIAFPEMALTGYECGEEPRREHRPCAMHRELAETIPGPATEEIARLARQLDVYVVLGMPEQDKADPGVRYISAPLIGPEGVIGVYRKLHLGPLPVFTEDICFSPGNEIPVFETRYGPIGIQICADVWRFPEVSRIITLKGARLIINPAATYAGPGKTAFVVNTSAVRATENYIYFATAAMTGPGPTFAYQGDSVIAGPAYPRVMHIYAQAGDREEIITATLSFERLHQWTARHDWKQERRAELISREFANLLKKS
ncbi:MAG: carbon-nitrogen hydrolase family protein [Chloroflexota bacterium]